MPEFEARGQQHHSQILIWYDDIVQLFVHYYGCLNQAHVCCSCLLGNLRSMIIL